MNALMCHSRMHAKKKKLLYCTGRYQSRQVVNYVYLVNYVYITSRLGICNNETFIYLEQCWKTLYKASLPCMFIFFFFSMSRKRIISDAERERRRLYQIDYRERMKEEDPDYNKKEVIRTRVSLC